MEALRLAMWRLLPQPLNVAGSNTTISASGGNIYFNQSGQDINVSVAQSADPGPLVGTIVAEGANVSITDTSDSDIVMGNVAGTSSVTLGLNGTGDISSLSGTAITTPSLTIGTQGGSIGLTAPLLTVANTITPMSGVDASVNISNNLPFDTTTISSGWEVTYSFYVYSTGTTQVGSIKQDAGNDGSITVEELAGTLEVTGSASILAYQGSIILEIDTSGGGAIQVDGGATIAAQANGSGILVGNVNLLVGSAGSPSACPTIANFDTTGSAPVPQCGPYGFTANAPTNVGFASGRQLLIYSPNASTITLKGDVTLNALN